MKTVTNIIYHALAVFTFACLVSPHAAGVCQQGCDVPHYNAFLGDDALHSNTTGFENVAIGCQALFSNTTGGTNTAVGSSALSSNTIGNENTACGRNALSLNSSGKLVRVWNLNLGLRIRPRSVRQRITLEWENA